MACNKVFVTRLRFIAVELEKDLFPGNFEHAAHCLLEHKIDLSGLAERYRNDLTGAATEMLVAADDGKLGEQAGRGLALPFEGSPRGKGASQ